MLRTLALIVSKSHLQESVSNPQDKKSSARIVSEGPILWESYGLLYINAQHQKTSAPPVVKPEGTSNNGLSEKLDLLIIPTN